MNFKNPRGAARVFDFMARQERGQQTIEWPIDSLHIHLGSEGSKDQVNSCETSAYKGPLKFWNKRAKMSLKWPAPLDSITSPISPNASKRYTVLRLPLTLKNHRKAEPKVPLRAPVFHKNQGLRLLCQELIPGY